MGERIREPGSGALVAWGLDDDGEGPDLVAAWAPGNKGAAQALALVLHENRARLEEAGVDLATLRATCNDRPARSQRFDLGGVRFEVGKSARDLLESVTDGRCGRTIGREIEVDGRRVLPACSSPAGHHGTHRCEFDGVEVEWPGEARPAPPGYWAALVRGREEEGYEVAATEDAAVSGAMRQRLDDIETGWEDAQRWEVEVLWGCKWHARCDADACPLCRDAEPGEEWPAMLVSSTGSKVVGVETFDGPAGATWERDHG